MDDPFAAITMLIVVTERTFCREFWLLFLPFCCFSYLERLELGMHACLLHIELKYKGWMDAPMPMLIPHAVIKPINRLLSGSYVMALLSYLKLNFGRSNIILYGAYLAGLTMVRPFVLSNVWKWKFILA